MFAKSDANNRKVGGKTKNLERQKTFKYLPKNATKKNSIDTFPTTLLRFVPDNPKLTKFTPKIKIFLQSFEENV